MHPSNCLLQPRQDPQGKCCGGYYLPHHWKVLWRLRKSYPILSSWVAALLDKQGDLPGEISTSVSLAVWDKYWYMLARAELCASGCHGYQCVAQWLVLTECNLARAEVVCSIRPQSSHKHSQSHTLPSFWRADQSYSENTGVEIDMAKTCCHFGCQLPHL